MLKILEGSGSAIFLHCSVNKPTKGCIAIDKKRLEEILKKVEKGWILK